MGEPDQKERSRKSHSAGRHKHGRRRRTRHKSAHHNGDRHQEDNRRPRETTYNQDFIQTAPKVDETAKAIMAKFSNRVH